MKMMQNKAVDIISKPPKWRSDSEVKAVLPWLKKKSEILNGCEDDVLKDLIRNCSHRRAYRDDVIVVQGDKGDCFYIMLSGQTSVYIDTLKSDTDSNELTSVVNMDVTTDAMDDVSVNATFEDDENSNDGKKNKQLDRSKYGKYIMRFDSGKSFGEIALISEDSVRNATVIADEETDMLEIHRDLFNRSVKWQQKKEYQLRKAFISRSHLFNSWTPKFKHLLEMSLRKVVYPFDTHIMKQGDPVDGLYFIVSGEAKVTTNPLQHKQQYSELFKKDISLLEQELGRQTKVHVKHKETSLTQPQIQVRRQEGYAAAEKRQMSKSVVLCFVGEEEIQGDLETVMEMPTWAYTVTCTAATTVFVLDDKNYERLVLRKNLQTIVRLKEHVLKKLRGRLALPSAQQIPLLQVVHDKLLEQLKPKAPVPPEKETESSKQVIIAQMVQLYMQGKTQLIDPLLPDSFHHRIKTEKKNAQIESRARMRIEEQQQLRRRRRRVPRSLKQLQNSAAEAELLPPETRWLLSSSPTRGKQVRPRTAIGIERQTMTDYGDSIRPKTAVGKTEGRTVAAAVASARPKTAIGKTTGTWGGIFHLTQCESTDEFGQPVEKALSVSPDEEYDNVFQQMDAFQKEKCEIRTRVICSAAAKEELRQEAERAKLSYLSEDFFDDDESYFDWETSATNLKNLEDKIRSFCDAISTTDKHDPLVLDELKTFELRNQEHVPVAGGTVFVKRKPCQYPAPTKEGSNVHQHIRRFMITRQPTYSAYSMSSRPMSAPPRSTS